MREPKFELVLRKLEKYCEKELWKGYDPYDGLNSLIIQSLLLNRKPLFRLAWSYVIRTLPFNVRPILLVNKGYNPKALALFISSYSRLFKNYKEPEYLGRAKFLARLLELEQINRFSGL